MVQEIAPSVFNNAYTPCAPDRESRAMLFEDNRLLVSEETWELPYVCEVETPEKELRYLFAIDEVRYYLAQKQAQLPQDYAMHSMHESRSHAKRKTLFAAYTGYLLYLWYSRHRFCGRCGVPTVHDRKLRMLHCPSCDLQIFPTISPAVIIGLTDGDRILLSKYAHSTYTQYALLAGFTEIGETMEETVQREVIEETGLEVENIRYWGSQPWGCDGGVLMGFFCDLKGSDRIRLDETELASAEWKHWRDVPDGIDDVSLTSEMMRAFRRKWEGKT